jgi:predicted nucleic acid-binding protein
MVDKAKKLKIYWDSNVWVAWANNEDNLRPLCTAILKEAEAGNLRIVVGALVYAEFAPQNENVSRAFDQYLDRYLFIFVNLDRPIAKRARMFVERFEHLKGRDAVHLATALHAKADVLHTFDKDLLRIASQVDEIRICKPEWPSPQQRLLFDEAAATNDVGI